MAEFYDHPHTGKLHFKGVAGGGTSEFDGPATATDIRNYPHEHARHIEMKHAVARAKAEAVAALKAEEAVLHEQVAEAEAHQDAPAEVPAAQ